MALCAPVFALLVSVEAHRQCVAGIEVTLPHSLKGSFNHLIVFHQQCGDMLH